MAAPDPWWPRSALDVPTRSLTSPVQRAAFPFPGLQSAVSGRKVFRNDIRCGGLLLSLKSIVYDDANYRSETKILENI